MTTNTETHNLPQDWKDWDTYFIEMAILASTKSKDDSTKVGCVIVSQDNAVLSTGYNGFPRGVKETELVYLDANYPELASERLISERWHKRPDKYNWVEHAERNAIYNAAREGIALKGSRAYLNWEPAPCEGCTRALIQSGVVEIIGPNIPFGGKGNGVYYDTNTITTIMLGEAKIKIRRINWSKA
jgi:dCMP deaminase